jgi:hypothetical protein
MQTNSLADGQVSVSAFHSSERRKNSRFDMHFPVLLRGLGDSWAASETTDVSASGAFFVTEQPFLLNTPMEYVLTFPPDLTKAPVPLRVRFFAMVLRCERVPGRHNAFGVAVRNTAHRYLTREESARFSAIEPQPSLSAPTATSQPQETET